MAGPFKYIGSPERVIKIDGIDLLAPLVVTASAAADAAGASAAAAAISAAEVPDVRTGVGLGTYAKVSRPYGSNTTNTTATNAAKIYSRTVVRQGKLTDYSLKSAGPGTGLVFIKRPVDGVGGGGASYRAEVMHAVTLTVTGSNPFANLTDAVRPGDEIGYKRLTGSLLAYQSGTGTLHEFNASDFSAVGDVGVMTIGGAGRIGISWIVEEAKNSHEDRLIARENAAAVTGTVAATVGKPAALTPVTIGTTTPNSSTPANINTAYATPPLTAYGPITHFGARETGGGVGDGFVLRPRGDGSFIAVYWQPDIAVLDGEHFYPLTVPFDGAPGDVGLIAMRSGSNLRFASIPQNTLQFPAIDLQGLGSISTPTVGTANTIAISLTQLVAASSHEKRLIDLENGTAGISNRVVRGPITRINEAFTGLVLPAGWATGNVGGTGAWSVSDGLIPPTTGGWGSYAVFDHNSSAFQRSHHADFNNQNASSVFGICSVTYNNQGGAAALLDTSTGTLTFYEWLNDGNPGTSVGTATFPSGAVANGADVRVWWERTGAFSVAAYAIKRTTNETISVSYTFSAGNKRPFLHGKPGIMFHSGLFKCSSFLGLVNSPVLVRAAFLGDSLMESSHDYQIGPSYAHMCATARGTKNDILVAAKGADTSTQGLARMPDDLGLVKADIAIWGYITNDSNLTTWTNNTGAFVDYCYSVGTEPAFVTGPPRADRQTFLNDANGRIVGNYFGKVRYIDAAAVVTTGNDRQTWNAALRFQEPHWNAAGNTAIFARALVDIPELRAA
jgi:hypothetical protein